MSSPKEKHKLFVFKSFSLSHSRCAMKIGTDGTLVGAWSTPREGSPSHILDVGCGCGLITLMMAQRFPLAHVTGVETDSAAVEDARENVINSPWSSRVDIVWHDFLSFSPPVTYDMVVCNPPFFTSDVHSPHRERDTARHADSLPVEDFARRCSLMISSEGCVNVIYPEKDMERVLRAFSTYGLHPYRICRVRDKAASPVKRVLMAFSPCEVGETDFSTLVIRDDDNMWSSQYKSLTRDFHPEHIMNTKK